MSLLLLPRSFPWLQRAGTPLLCGVSFFCRGLSCWEAQAERCAGFRRSSTCAQQLWLWGLVTAGHGGSFRTRDRSHVPCFGKWILNPWNTREVPTLCCFFFSPRCSSVLHWVWSLLVPRQYFSVELYSLGLSGRETASSRSVLEIGGN